MVNFSPKPFDTFVNIAEKSFSVTVSITGIDWLVILISAGGACGFTMNNKVIYEIVMQNRIINIKIIMIDHNQLKLFDKKCRKSFQKNEIDQKIQDYFTNHTNEKKTILIFQKSKI